MSDVDFGDFSATFSGGHGLRLERLPLGRPGARPERRPYQAGVAAGPTVVGREHPLGLARTAVRERAMIEFTAECGTGKTALLRESAADVYIRVGGIRPDDLLQDLVREFYVYPAGGRRLSSEECRHALGQVGAVVALDDVDYEPGQLASLRRALAACAVLVGATRPVLGGLGSSYALPGLAEPAAVDLLSQEVGRYLAESEMPAVRRLVAAVGGQPLHLRQAAALVRRDGHTFADLARRAESDPGVLDQLAISAAGPRAKRALAVLTLLGGVLLPADLIAAMSEVTYISAELEELFGRGLAEKRDDRFGLPVCKAEPYRQIFYRYLGLGASLRGIGTWLAARDPSGQDARGAAEAALGLLGFAAEQGEWAGIVRLTAVVERVLFVQGHWQAWQQALGHGITAAQQAGDTAAEAYFSHQRGTLHFLEDRSQAAVRDLRHALDLRSALGDGPGSAVTRHNLGFAVAAQATPPRPTALPTPPPPPPPPPPTSPAPPAPRDRRRRVAAAVIGVVAVIVLGVTLGQSVFGNAGSSGSSGGDTSGSGGWTSDPYGPIDSQGTADGGTTNPGDSQGGTSDGSDNGTSIGTITGASGGTTDLQPPVIEGAADYGDVHVDPIDVIPSQDFTITNPNAEPLSLDAVALDPSGTDFGITGDTCAESYPAELAAGATCTVTVEFSPTVLGSASTTLAVSSAAGDAVTSDLTGRAFAVVVAFATVIDSFGTHGSVEVTVDGLTTPCEPDRCEIRYYDQSAAVTVQAVPDSGYELSGWSNNSCDDNSDTCAPGLGEDVTAAATFAAHLR